MNDLNKFYEIKKNESKKNLLKKIRSTIVGKHKPYIKLHKRKFYLAQSKNIILILNFDRILLKTNHSELVFRLKQFIYFIFILEFILLFYFFKNIEFKN